MRILHGREYPFKIISWIRLPGLNYRYYTKGLIRALASVIGKVVKVDYNTADGTKGKFARVAVMVDISKPLVSFIGVDGKKTSQSLRGTPVHIQHLWQGWSYQGKMYFRPE